MDFEPKKRELYEMATDTKERQSRSIESLTLGKSTGTTKSLEVLDVDMGGSVGVGAQASFAGTGGGFNFSSSNQGQWGTDYYAENLRHAGVPMDGFLQRLDYLRASPQQACAIGEELLRYASLARRASVVHHARVAGLWLFLWGSVDCYVEAGQ